VTVYDVLALAPFGHASYEEAMRFVVDGRRASPRARPDGDREGVLRLATELSGHRPRDPVGAP